LGPCREREYTIAKRLGPSSTVENWLVSVRKVREKTDDDPARWGSKAEKVLYGKRRKKKLALLLQNAEPL